MDLHGRPLVDKRALSAFLVALVICVALVALGSYALWYVFDR